MSKMEIDAFGNKRWRNRSGKHHREGGPAIEYKNGTRHWYRNGRRHREGGPAIEYSDGQKEWYRNGLLHREDGPAVESGKHREYWYCGEKHSDVKNDEEWGRIVRLMVLR